MKTLRILVSIVLICAFLFFSVALSEEAMHMLWDLPMGGTVEECASLAEEATGIPPSVGETSVQIGYLEPAEVLGERVFIDLLFESNALTQAVIKYRTIKYGSSALDRELKAMARDELIEYTIAQYANTINGLIDRFGAITDGEITVFYQEPMETKRYDVPMAANVIDVEAIENAAMNSRVNGISISVYIKNIEARMSLSGMYGKRGVSSERTVNFEDGVLYNRQGLPAFVGPDGRFPFVGRAANIGF